MARTSHKLLVLAAGFCAALGSAALPARAQDDRPAIVVAVQAVPDSLTPCGPTRNITYRTLYNVFDFLIGTDFKNDYALRPSLATEWRRVDDRTMELTLREGVTFHDGSEMTAEDVAFSLGDERMMAEDAPCHGVSRQFLGTIDKVEATGPYALKVTTKNPDPILAVRLGGWMTQIVSKAAYQGAESFETFSHHPVGTGPYKVVDFDLHNVLTLEAHNDYWGGAPSARQVVFRQIPEVSARITALANGEADIINSITPDQLPAIERLDCCDVRSVLVNSHVLNYNTANPAMADARFRRGLNMAIDRQLLVDSLWGGKAEVLNAHQYPEWPSELYDADRKGWPFDPDKARELIAASGYDGAPIYLNTHPVYYTNGVNAAQAIVEMWRAVGVNAEVRVDENWYDLAVDDPKLTVRNLSDWQIPADPAVTLVWSWSTTALWSGNEAFLELAGKARSTLDVELRRDLYGKMLDLYLQEAPGVDLYRVSEFYGARKGVEWSPYTDYTLDFRPGNLSFR